MKKSVVLLFTFLFLFHHMVAAQSVQMADALRQSGKIYVVVGTIALIFIGILVYLVLIDRRLSKIEKDQK